MNEVTIFLFGLSITLITSLSVVFYLGRHLRHILVELCGGQGRADFWRAFSNIAIILMPAIFAICRIPDLTGSSVLSELSDQLKWSLAGLAATVLILGYLMSKFILRFERKAAVSTRAEA